MCIFDVVGIIAQNPAHDHFGPGFNFCSLDQRMNVICLNRIFVVVAIVDDARIAIDESQIRMVFNHRHVLVIVVFGVLKSKRQFSVFLIFKFHSVVCIPIEATVEIISRIGSLVNIVEHAYNLIFDNAVCFAIHIKTEASEVER